jgi:integral membrane protein
VTDADQSAPPTVSETARPNAAAIPGALTRYRVLAWITGIWLLVLVGEMIAKYGFGVDDFSWIGVVHGWVYFVYLIFCIDLAIKARWGFGKTLGTALAGTIPFLSFYVEHIRTRDVKQAYGL